MKLTEIYTRFETDKGTAHNYINFYESIFNKIRLNELFLLEIGVLFGGSLKMWSCYFENSKIFGLDNFSQKTGEGYYNYKPINVESIKTDLSTYKNISLFDFDCESVDLLNLNFNGLNFDIIIDDASHKLSQQIKNLNNFSNYLNSSGIYICEDIQSYNDGLTLLNVAKNLYPNKRCDLIEFNIQKKTDDRILVIV